jgi:hypothetical protein
MVSIFFDKFYISYNFIVPKIAGVVAALVLLHPEL